MIPSDTTPVPELADRTEDPGLGPEATPALPTPEEDFHQIERVLKTRVVRDQAQVKVKWVGSDKPTWTRIDWCTPAAQREAFDLAGPNSNWTTKATTILSPDGGMSDVVV